MTFSIRFRTLGPALGLGLAALPAHRTPGTSRHHLRAQRKAKPMAPSCGDGGVGPRLEHLYPQDLEASPHPALRGAPRPPRTRVPFASTAATPTLTSFLLDGAALPQCPFLEEGCPDAHSQIQMGQAPSRLRVPHISLWGRVPQFEGLACALVHQHQQTGSLLGTSRVSGSVPCQLLPAQLRGHSRDSSGWVKGQVAPGCPRVGCGAGSGSEALRAAREGSHCSRTGRQSSG